MSRLSRAQLGVVVFAVLMTFLSIAAFATPATVTIDKAAAQADPTGISPILFTVVFGNAVESFGDPGDVILSGTAGATTAVIADTGDHITYTVTVTGMTTDGTVIATVPAGAANNLGKPYNPGHSSLASTSTDNSVLWSFTPLVTIDKAVGQADPTNAQPILFTAVFSEPVTGFADADVTLSGTAGATTAVVTDTGDGMTYSVSVSGAPGYGTVIADVPAGVAQDADLNWNAASFSTDNSVMYTDDITPPTATIDQAATQADPTTKSPILFEVEFNEEVVGFETGDVAISGGAGATTAIVTDSGDHKNFTVEVSGMTQTGTVIADIPAGVCTDQVGNLNAAATFTDNQVTFNMKPWNVMMLPSSGTVLIGAPIMLRNQFLDVDGASDIRICYTLVSDASRSWTNAVYLQYNAAYDKIYLRNDANSAWSAGYTPGTDVTLENSQAVVSVKNTTVTKLGNYVTIDWVLQMKPTMAGKNLWGWSFVQDYSAAYDGWIKTGEYSSNMPLSSMAMLPNAGPLPIMTDQTFSVLYFDGNGAADIKSAYLLINDSIAQTDAIMLYYNRAANRVYLKNDENTSWGTGYAPGSAVILENHQCYVNVAAITTSTMGANGLLVNWVVKLRNSMSGKKLSAWTYLQDNSLNIENWKVLGQFYAQLAPRAAGFDPVATIQTGTASAVTVSWSDANGYGNLERCYALLTTQMGNIRYTLPTAQVNAIYVRYNAYENKIYLKNDANTSWGTGYVPGDTATLTNTQCSIDVAASTVTHPDANTTKLELMVTPTWAAGTTLGGWLQARDAGGALSDWTPMTPQAPDTPLTVVP